MAAQTSPHDVQARTSSVPARAIRSRAVNVGGGERWLSLAAGTVAALWASRGRRRSTGGRAVLAAASALLFERGLTGSCRLYRLIGWNTVPGMPRDGWRDFEQARRDLAQRARRSIERTVTVLRPRLEVGTALRDVSRWPLFADQIEATEVSDARHARLRLRPVDGRQLIFDLELDEDLPDAALAWRVFNRAGHAVARLAIGLADAPGDRGTEVRLSAVADTNGTPNAPATWLAGEAPDQQARRILRRFKQWMEAGEVVSAAGPAGRRAADPVLSRLLQTRTDAPPRALRGEG